MEKIKEAVTAEINKRWSRVAKEAQSTIIRIGWQDTNRNQQEQIKKALEQIEKVSKAEDFNNPLIITVEWKKSRTWGSNPKAYTNYGFEGENISGCGYCKKSTATAQALNSHLPLIKLLYEKKNEALKSYSSPDDDQNKINRSILGYGSGYGVLPYFEGGVGVSSHRNIIQGLGLVWEYVISTKNTDVFRIALK